MSWHSWLESCQYQMLQARPCRQHSHSGTCMRLQLDGVCMSQNCFCLAGDPCAEVCPYSKAVHFHAISQWHHAVTLVSISSRNGCHHKAGRQVLICMSGLQDFYRNFSKDPKVKIPWVRRDLSGPRVLTMEWIDGIRCTDPVGIRASGMDVAEFIRCGVVTGLRQLLEVSMSPKSYPCFRPLLHLPPSPPCPPSAAVLYSS